MKITSHTKNPFELKVTENSVELKTLSDKKVCADVSGFEGAVPTIKVYDEDREEIWQKMEMEMDLKHTGPFPYLRKIVIPKDGMIKIDSIDLPQNSEWRLVVYYNGYMIVKV